jgi:preprotein translocase subunit SecA
LEIIRLVRDLRRAARAEPEKADRIAVIENATRRGEFDATKAASDRWAASKDGQDLRRAARADGDALGAQVSRNDPCPCGSGEKYKRCHG